MILQDSAATAIMATRTQVGEQHDNTTDRIVNVLSMISETSQYRLG